MYEKNINYVEITIRTPRNVSANHLCNLNTCLNNNNECRNVCLARKDISKGFVKENVILICCDEAKSK